MTKRPSVFAVFTLLTFAAAFPSFMRAQQFAPERESSSLASTDLPDAPGALLMGESLFQTTGPQSAKPGSMATALPPEPKDRRVIPWNRTAQPLSAKDKMTLSLLSRVTPFATASTLLSTSIAYWRNSAPHYGTNLPAFGERFGAAELRQTSQAFFSYGLYAAAFHDDPRYYVMGPKETFTKRAIYSATRAVITRKDDGRAAPNWPRMLGVASAVALTNAYYPDQDRGVRRTVTSTFSIIGTTAASNELHEFLGDILHRVLHKDRDASQP
jgi:hypothetical protein